MLSPHSHGESSPACVEIVVAGPSGVGKTTFVASVAQLPPLLTAASFDTQTSSGPPTTADIDHGHVWLDDELALCLIAAPAPTPQLATVLTDLCSRPLGALVLADATRLADTFPVIDYFESHELTYAVVVNLVDGQLLHPLDEIREALALAPDVPLLKCNAMDPTSVITNLAAFARYALVRAEDPQ